MNRHKSTTKYIIKLIVGFLLIWILAKQINVLEVRQVYINANKWMLVSAVVVFYLGVILETKKFESACLKKISFSKSIKFVFMGLFFNTFLPSNVGGDSYKIVLLNNERIDKKQSFFFVVMDRATGLMALMILGAVSFFLIDKTTLMNQLASTITIRFSLVMYLLVFILIPLLLIIVWKFQNKLKNLVKAKGTYIVNYFKSGWSRVLIWGLFFQTARGIAITLMTYSLGGSLHIGETFICLAIVAIISMLPISVGGFGVREGVMSFSMNSFGVPLEIAGGVALMNMSLVLTKALIGGVIFTIEKRK
ncbi:lysylphosphatidylglycerol synthase transmembrane domain-containing protein [Tindallia californiensis]|uniref:Phosphatidylglycerol lysyltransferase n=1 Tax=Tindallia californiensis TaxID=159292 RepID=A0A1H3PC20_9FIRM|nr:lysylphosphatidylglycerol synthase transmembrane domain-containing protein [Tindallia californiensis]SDY98702.1 conserved hypothetical protein [Tindallia californiensis]